MPPAPLTPLTEVCPPNITAVPPPAAILPGVPPTSRLYPGDDTLTPTSRDVGVRIRFPEGEREVMSELAPEAAAPKSALSRAVLEAWVPPRVMTIGPGWPFGADKEGLDQALATPNEEPLRMAKLKIR